MTTQNNPAFIPNPDFDPSKLPVIYREFLTLFDAEIASALNAVSEDVSNDVSALDVIHQPLLRIVSTYRSVMELLKQLAQSLDTVDGLNGISTGPEQSCLDLIGVLVEREIGGLIRDSILGHAEDAGLTQEDLEAGAEKFRNDPRRDEVLTKP